MSATKTPSLQAQSTDEGRTHLVVQIKTSARVARQIEAILRETGTVSQERAGRTDYCVVRRLH
jgi:hypothetical protein